MHRFGMPNRIITDLGSLHSYKIQKLGVGLRLQHRLRISRTSRSQRTGRKGQWTHTSRVETKTVWRASRLWIKMDWRITQSSMGATNSNKQSHRILAFLPSLRIRSRTTYWLDLDVTMDRTIWRRSRTHPKIRTWQYRRSQSKHYPAISEIPPRTKAPLQQEYPVSIVTSRRPSTKKNTKNRRTP